MAREKDTPQKAVFQEIMGNYLKENNVKVKDETDVNAITENMMSIILESALDQEMNEGLKETDNSRNGHSQKTMHTRKRAIQLVSWMPSITMYATKARL